jgi:putative transposase
MPLETVKLTASFKLNGSIPEGLFSTYREVLDQLLDHACAKGITSFKRLKAEKYRELRAKYPRLPCTTSTQHARWPAISTRASGGTGE